MTVSSEVKRSDYAGNGSTTAFATGFRFLQNSDLKVILTVDATGVETVQAETTNYTVTGAGLDAGGTVTMLVAPPSGETLTIKRNLTLTQTTDYVENDSFPAESHETALDKLTMITQQLQEELDRSLKLAEAQSSSGLILPVPVTDRFLQWDSSGNLKNVDIALQGALSVSDFAKTYLDELNAADTRGVLECPSDDNLLKGNQNWNVQGADITLTTSNQTPTTGQEFTLGWVAQGGSIVDISRSTAGVVTATSGTARHTYPKDLSGRITASTAKFYVVDGSGVQTLATGSNGLTVSDDSSNVYLDIDFATYTGGVAYVALVLKEGFIQPINDSDSRANTLAHLSADNFLHVQDQKANNTIGDLYSSGSYAEIVLNTVLSNTIVGASLASNRINLPAGTYYVEAFVPIYAGATGVGNTKARISNYTDTSVLLLGQNMQVGDAQTHTTLVSGEFTLTAAKDINIEARASVSFRTGLQTAFGDNEIYTDIKIWKVR